MKKKYKCRLSATSLLVNIKGKVIRIEFEPDVIGTYGLRGCSYKTENADIQYAIEHCKRFSKVREFDLSNAAFDAIWTDDADIKVNVEKEVTPVQAFSAPEVAAPVVEEEKPKRVKRIKKEA